MKWLAVLAGAAALMVGVAVVGLSAASGAGSAGSFPVLPTLSPDGSQLAWVEWQTGRVVTARVGRVRPYLRGARVFGPSWRREGIGDIAWTSAGIVVDADFELYLLSRTGHANRIGLAGDLAFSVGGSRVATGTFGCDICVGPIVVIDLHSHKRWRVGDANQVNDEPSLSPDGKQVAWMGPGGIWVSPVSGGSPRMLVAGGSCPQWSPDGRWIAYFADAGLQVIPASGGASETLTTLTWGCDNPGAPSWSPDSTRIAFEQGKGLPLWVVNVSSHSLVSDSTSLGITAGGFAWTANGSQLYVSVRPRAEETCTALWLLRSSTLRGKRLLNGCR